MVTIQQAVRAASEFAGEALGPARVAGLQLEEVETGSTNGEEAWLITLSMFAFPSEPYSGRREYKVFSVLKESGEVTSMRIRELAVS